MQVFINNSAMSEDIFSGTIPYGVGQSEERLQPGQLVEATVIFASNETANVRLSNGTVLRARLAAGVMLRQGDTVWLSIKANDGKSLEMQIVANSATAIKPMQTPAEMLSKAGLPQTPLNLSLAVALKGSGLSIETKWIEQASAILKEYPAVSLETAVFAAVNNIEPNAVNLTTIEATLQPDFKAGDLLIQIFSLLSDQSKLSNVQPKGMITPALGSLETDAGTIKEGAAVVRASVAEHNQQEVDSKPPVSDESIDWKQLFKNETGVTDKQGRQLQKAAEQLFFASLDRPEGAKALKQAGEQLLSRLEMFKSHAESNGYNAANAVSEMDKLIGGLRLLQDIDRYYYMQIPVLTGGRPSTAELYVFSKKRGAKKRYSDSTTILLVLDMGNLGHVEALVSINKSSISIRFELPDEEIAKFIRERTTALYNMVSGSGYHLSGISFQTGAQSVTPLTALKIAEQDISPGHQRINIRI